MATTFSYEELDGNRKIRLRIRVTDKNAGYIAVVSIDSAKIDGNFKNNQPCYTIIKSERFKAKLKYRPIEEGENFKDLADDGIKTDKRTWCSVLFNLSKSNMQTEMTIEDIKRRIESNSLQIGRFVENLIYDDIPNDTDNINLMKLRDALEIAKDNRETLEYIRYKDGTADIRNKFKTKEIRLLCDKITGANYGNQQQFDDLTRRDSIYLRGIYIPYGEKRTSTYIVTTVCEYGMNLGDFNLTRMSANGGHEIPREILETIEQCGWVQDEIDSHKFKYILDENQMALF